MDRKQTYEFLNSIKDPAMRNAIATHGIGEGSRLNDFAKAMSANPALKNTTEPRMTLYTAEINPYLYSDNSFIMKSENDAAFAASGETKVLNDSSIGPDVTRGRVYPKSLSNLDDAPTQTVKVRKNTSHEWGIEYFRTDPQVTTMELRSEVPYEVRQDLLKSHAENLMQSVANFTAVEWAQGTVGTSVDDIDITGGSDQYIFTSGTENRTNVISGGTGLVKRSRKEDLQNVKQAFSRQLVASKGTIYYLPTVEQYNDILLMKDFVDYEKSGNMSKLIMGEVGMVYGMTVLDPRHREDWNANVLYSYTALSGNETNLTKVQDTASSGANMASAGLFWVEPLVKRAQGSAIVFPWQNSPIYFGDVYATEMRYGAIKKRGDERGVVMLIDNPFTS